MSDLFFVLDLLLILLFRIQGTSYLRRDISLIHIENNLRRV